MKFDVIIIGAGAAGLFCASVAGQRGRSALVLESADKVGKKILISGGGRCNFTNLHAAPANYLSSNPHFHKSALARFMPQDFIALVNKHGIAFHEKKLGQLFCDTSAKEIVNLLLTECRAVDVRIRTGCTVTAVRKTDSFVIETSQGTFEASSLVIASGGLSIPKMGATDFGYRIARQFGLSLIPPRAALVPLTLNENDLRVFSPLSGVSVDARVSCGDQQFRENILFTHRGLSGPAILQISSYWQPGANLLIDLLPECDTRELLFAHSRDNVALSAILSHRLPQRFARAWAETLTANKLMKQFTPRELDHIATQLQAWHIKPNGTEGWRTAEVTAGGVNTDELSSKTMEAKKVPGLFFIGEVVDVTGWLGGYNFQWAWSSGFAAGQVV